VASPYADLWTDLTAQAVEPLLRAVDLRPGTTFVDVASGPGHVARVAAEQGARVLGIDFAPEMVALARAAHPDPWFCVGDAEVLPLRDAGCDAIVMSFGMLHLGQPERAAGEALRCLRSGGRYAFTVWAMPEEAVAFGAALRAIHDHGDPNVQLPAGPPFFRFSDPDACRQLLDGAGFREVAVETVPLTWRLPSISAVFEALFRGTPRTGGLLRRQTPEALYAIRGQFIAELAKYETEAGAVIPMPAVLAAGVRPA
jgi:SAM-dependent methyltransferase